MPSSAVRSFSDPDDYVAAIRQGTVEVTVTGTGNFAARSWGLLSVGVFRRAPGEMVWHSDHYRISCVLTDIWGIKRSDDGPVEEYRLGPATSRFGYQTGNYGAICPAAGLSRSCKVVRPTTIWPPNWLAAGPSISSRKTRLAIR